MKNLLNCHCIGLHSFPISLDENGHYKRVFYADSNHHLWKPIELAIHPHHVDIKITVLEGVLFNPIFKIDDAGLEYNKYIWDSHILNGKGGFTFVGTENLIEASNHSYSAGESVTMKACELHTVFVEQGKSAVWLIEETKPTCEYFPLNYSIHDLSKWKPDKLYFECDDTIKERYIGRFNL